MLLFTHYLSTYTCALKDCRVLAVIHTLVGCYVTDPGAAIKGVGDFVGDLFGAAEKFSHLG